MSKGPSKHLSWKEMACKDGTGYPDEWRINRAIPLAEVFETIRSAFGDKPIKILSAYRSPEHNRKIGGARNSQHVQGRALDLKPPNSVGIKEFYETIKELAGTLGIRGIGKYKTFVHVDIRPGSHLALWSGTGAKDSLS